MKEGLNMRITRNNETLIKAIEMQNPIHISRSKIDRNSIDGIPLLLGKELVLVQYLYDFQLDGYMIVKLKDITSIRSGNIERFLEMVLKQEGIYAQVEKPSLANIDDWSVVFKELKVMGKNVIIECEDLENAGFYIGKIIEVNTDSVLLLNFNAVGEWDQEPTTIPFKDITSVSIDKKYIVIMSKFVKQI
jgi:hypothetical protein